MKHKYKEQDHWNAIFSIAFLGIAVLGFWAISDIFGTTGWVYSISTFDIAILGLATFRLIRLLSYDKIFLFVRLWFLDVDSAQGEGGQVSYTKPQRGPRRTVSELLECIWCTGIWSALAVGILYFIHPLGTFLTIILAIGAVGSFFKNVSQAVAVHAQRR
jgi:hypothetical protein